MTYDVIILGGGPAGAVAAWALARAGRRVLVLDRADEGFRGGECLPPSARPILGRLGLEETLRAGPHLPCYANQSSWGAPELWEADFLRSPWGHGWHLDRAAFDRLLLDHAAAAGAEVRRRARFLGARREQSPGGRAQGWRVDWQGLDDRRAGQARCRFLVDATGLARVFLRQQAVDIERSSRQVARVATFSNVEAGKDARDPDTRTLLEAAPDGWWYTARIPGGRRTVMFFSDPDLPGFEALRDEASFLEALGATHFVARHIREGGYALSEPLLTRLAASSRACQSVGEGWLAAGDAAISFDPLSSQGVVTALRGGEQAGEALHAALAGEPAELRHYAASLDKAWTELLEESAKYYRMEARWSRSPFWRRRAVA